MSDEQADRQPVTTARPLTRRELRERERRQSSGPVEAPPAPVPHPEGSGDGVHAAVTPATDAVGDEPHAGPRVTTADRPDLLPPDGARYTARHYLVLALVASVLGFLVWSLGSTDADPDAAGATLIPSTTPPSVR